MGTHVDSRDQLGESKTVFAEHFQRLERFVSRSVLEFQSNLIIAGSALGQLEGNNRSIVSCVGRMYKQKAEGSATGFSPIPDISGLVTVALVTLNRLMNGL